MPVFRPFPGHEDVNVRSREAALKFYVVLEGRLRGIFTDELEARAQVNGTWRKAKTWVKAIEIWDEHCARHHGDGCPDMEIPPPPPRPAPSTPSSSTPCCADPEPGHRAVGRARTVTVTINASQTFNPALSATRSSASLAVSPTAPPSSRGTSPTSSITDGMSRVSSPHTHTHRARDDGRDLDQMMARLTLAPKKTTAWVLISTRLEDAHDADVE
ncbi:hypothetical protein B0H13DRAFT_2382347 [Mycena leptocephala]|nr:hypothetical protein B0H13DRAFT_2382347 [Mycena leptocephala]